MYVAEGGGGVTMTCSFLRKLLELDKKVFHFSVVVVELLFLLEATSLTWKLVKRREGERAVE